MVPVKLSGYFFEFYVSLQLYSPQKVIPKHPPQTRLSWYTPQIIELIFSPFSRGFHYPFSFSTFRDFRNCLTSSPFFSLSNPYIF
ncbi:hypothetical protein CPF_0358 [Clostridium perfringens ATCC 13124]|uniref:Uncharacterized protein n=1 Tax=Clostridium perfringens (strain ATCC 13124 / DSM 756 / JCM 1290 / NCIMB 6125 / NCTC 8237 / Type A) TaxID=195103 RepID=A0A0H2YPB0_CLOP1|nr:hypothetical protein CPF_0358 [Clostridium perfringens ATCC 13124]